MYNNFHIIIFIITIIIINSQINLFGNYEYSYNELTILKIGSLKSILVTTLIN